MKIWGLEISRASKQKQDLSHIDQRGGWVSIVREAFTGAWQMNRTLNQSTVMSFYAVYACMTLIAADISKLRVKLVRKDDDGIWVETPNPAYTPVIRAPNGFQNRQQFWENWVLSKLSHGNTYVLKGRDGRGVVKSLYILDPTRVQTLVSDDGQVFYRLNTDNLSGLGEQVTVPAREIIHDRMNCIFHPLVGVSPIYACALSASQGLAIQNNSTAFFENGSRPGGVITAPGNIDEATATKLSEAWNSAFTGANRGKTAILGNGLKYEPMTITPEDAKLVDQLKLSAEHVCSVFHVPPFMIGVGAEPTYNNVALRQQQYYSQCLQVLIEAAELCFDEGLGIGFDSGIGIEFDLDDLIRMDPEAKAKVLGEGINRGFVSPNEARAKMDMTPVAGGGTPYLQQQNYSLAALAKRDAQADPFATAKPANDAAPPEPDDTERAVYAVSKRFYKGARDARR